MTVYYDASKDVLLIVSLGDDDTISLNLGESFFVINLRGADPQMVIDHFGLTYIGEL